MIPLLCVYNITNACEGYVTEDTAYTDENGDKWDICVPCAEHERKILNGRS